MICGRIDKVFRFYLRIEGLRCNVIYGLNLSVIVLIVGGWDRMWNLFEFVPLVYVYCDAMLFSCPCCYDFILIL